MNYPELIWRLIELVLQKDINQEIDEVKKDKQLNADTHVRLYRSIDWYSTTT